MTKKELVAVEKQLLREVPGFTIVGDLMLLPPVKTLLRGICFQGSRFNKSTIFADMFVMPLCVPSKHLNLTYGSRVRHEGVGDIWDKNMENLTSLLGRAIRDYAVPYLTELDTLPKFIEHLQIKANTIRIHESLAVMLAQEERFSESLKYLNMIVLSHDKASLWQVEVAAQAEILMSKILSDPIEALEQLKTWEDQTTHALGLAAYRDD